MTGAAAIVSSIHFIEQRFRGIFVAAFWHRPHSASDGAAATTGRRASAKARASARATFTSTRDAVSAKATRRTLLRGLSQAGHGATEIVLGDTRCSRTGEDVALMSSAQASLRRIERSAANRAASHRRSADAGPA